MGTNFWKSLGPGLLFAGAAVGVSHLVQSTRAGADYGFSLLVFVLLACLFKYPAFAAGPFYAAATGKSLVSAYHNQGRWALLLFGLLTLATMFTVEAAVTAMAAGLAVSLLGGATSTLVMSGILLLSCCLVLRVGGFAWLDALIKLMVVVLTLCTFLATILALPKLHWAGVYYFPEQFDLKTILFVAALVGWMPSAIDIAVWHSLWTLARQDQTGHKPQVKEAVLDFKIGYIGTTLLAVCFLILGAAVMQSSGTEFAPQAHLFAAQVVDLYAVSLGEWSRPLIGVAAFAIMYSTTLTVVDGFPRALSQVWLAFRKSEPSVEEGRRGPYWVFALLIGLGALAIIGAFPASLKGLVDLATTLSFLTAPLLAWLNHRALFGPDIAKALQPALGFRIHSLAGIWFLGSFAVFYCYLLL